MFFSCLNGSISKQNVLKLFSDIEYVKSNPDESQEDLIRRCAERISKELDKRTELRESSPNPDSKEDGGISFVLYFLQILCIFCTKQKRFVV